MGMGRDLHERFDSVRSLYRKAEEILGFDLAAVSFSGAEETLKETRYTQPALFVHSIAAAELLKEKGIRASAAAGHSLGEYSALACAGAIQFEHALALVRERARLMWEAGKKNPGAMAAIIGLDPETVMSVCVDVEGGLVQPANYNTQEQVVISGTAEGVAAAALLAEKRGAKRVVPLQVSGAFHSPLMADAMEEFGRILDDTPVRMPEIPVYANVTAVPVSSEEEIRSLLHHQLTHSVRWLESVQNMMKDGISHFIEAGPGRVLSGMIKKINREADVRSCGTAQDLDTFGSPS